MKRFHFESLKLSFSSEDLIRSVDLELCFREKKGLNYSCKQLTGSNKTNHRFAQIYFKLLGGLMLKGSV